MCVGDVTAEPEKSNQSKNLEQVANLEILTGIAARLVTTNGSWFLRMVDRGCPSAQRLRTAISSSLVARVINRVSLPRHARPQWGLQRIGPGPVERFPKLERLQLTDRLPRVVAVHRHIAIQTGLPSKGVRGPGTSAHRCQLARVVVSIARFVRHGRHQVWVAHRGRRAESNATKSWAESSRRHGVSTLCPSNIDGQ